VTRDEAARCLREIAVAVNEPDESAAVARYLELVAVRDDAIELRGALVEMGARAVMRVVHR
jgi:hypothetical protein